LQPKLRFSGTATWFCVFVRQRCVSAVDALNSVVVATS
jgi:hypothetical protein